MKMPLNNNWVAFLFFLPDRKWLLASLSMHKQAKVND